MLCACAQCAVCEYCSHTLAKRDHLFGAVRGEKRKDPCEQRGVTAASRLECPHMNMRRPALMRSTLTPARLPHVFDGLCSGALSHKNHRRALAFDIHSNQTTPRFVGATTRDCALPRPDHFGPGTRRHTFDVDTGSRFFSDGRDKNESRSKPRALVVQRVTIAMLRVLLRQSNDDSNHKNMVGNCGNPPLKNLSKVKAYHFICLP